MLLTLFGANGPTGRELTAQALTAGHRVRAVTRHAADFPLSHPELEVVTADVFDPAAVEQAIGGADAVLSTLGVPYTRDEVHVYSDGVRHMLAGMSAHGTSRIVVVSASLVDPTLGPHGGFFVDKVAGPIVASFGRTVYADMRRMESLLAESTAAWTVMRPSGLFATSAPTDYRIAPDYLPGAYTSRADLAAAMLAQLDTDEYVRRICAVSTVDASPSLVSLIFREGAKRSSPRR